MSYLDYFPMPMSDQTTVVLSVAVGLSMTGLAIAFIAAEPKSAITRAFAVAYGVSGLGIATEVPYVFLFPVGSHIPWFARFPVFVMISTAAFPLWLLRLARTAQPTPLAMKWITRCVWSQWIMVAVFFVLGGLFPEQRLHDFYMGMGRPDTLQKPGFWMFAVPIGAATINLTLGGAILFTQRIDAAERKRALAFALSFPFLACVFSLPAGYNLLACLVGELIFLVGAVRYHVMQGERGQFMSRFLSPQVAKLVSTHGLAYTMQPQVLEVTVVCCDLRGFTHFAKVRPSEQVIQLLGEYYEAAGSAVAEIGATIKDYAGDGILILVGAPLPVQGHAIDGIKLARRVEAAAQLAVRHWTRSDAPLGVGVGVASGRVTVGAIGSSSRMEYTAVGSAVNLASRLCAEAHDHEILVDERTTELTGQQGLVSRGRLALKGMGETLHYALVGA